MLATTPAVIETALKIVKDEEIDELRIELDSLENKFEKDWATVAQIQFAHRHLPKIFCPILFCSFGHLLKWNLLKMEKTFAHKDNCPISCFKLLIFSTHIHVCNGNTVGTAQTATKYSNHWLLLWFILTTNYDLPSNLYLHLKFVYKIRQLCVPLIQKWVHCFAFWKSFYCFYLEILFEIWIKI